MEIIEFPFPRGGPIFSTIMELLIPDGLISVSVPTKGTHLLYTDYSDAADDTDKVSVPTKGTHLLYYD